MSELQPGTNMNSNLVLRQMIQLARRGRYHPSCLLYRVYCRPCESLVVIDGLGDKRNGRKKIPLSGNHIVRYRLNHSNTCSNQFHSYLYWYCRHLRPESVEYFSLLSFFKSRSTRTPLHNPICWYQWARAALPTFSHSYHVVCSFDHFSLSSNL